MDPTTGYSLTTATIEDPRSTTMSVGNPVTAAPAHSAVNVRAESQSRVWSLIRRAVNFLDRDRSEAWRCLKDAYTLLGEESVGDALVPRAVPAVQPGGLAA